MREAAGARKAGGVRPLSGSATHLRRGWRPAVHPEHDGVLRHASEVWRCGAALATQTRGVGSRDGGEPVTSLLVLCYPGSNVRFTTASPRTLRAIEQVIQGTTQGVT